MDRVKNQYYFYTKLHFMAENEVLTLQDKATVNQITQVLRMKVGQPIVLLDGIGKKALCFLIEIHKQVIKVVVKTVVIEIKKEPGVSIAVGRIKREKLKQVIAQATQLGADSIFVLPTQYSKVEGEHLVHKRDYFDSVAKESLEQSTNSFLPKIFFIEQWQDFFSQVKREEAELYACHLKKNTSLLIDSYTPEFKKAIICIGPEGGFSENEVKLLESANTTIVGLGQGILKVETACIVALGWVKMMQLQHCAERKL